MFFEEIRTLVDAVLDAKEHWFDPGFPKNAKGLKTKYKMGTFGSWRVRVKAIKVNFFLVYIFFASWV